MTFANAEAQTISRDCKPNIPTDRQPYKEICRISFNGSYCYSTMLDSLGKSYSDSFFDPVLNKTIKCGYGKEDTFLLPVTVSQIYGSNLYTAVYANMEKLQGYNCYFFVNNILLDSFDFESTYFHRTYLPLAFYSNCTGYYELRKKNDNGKISEFDVKRKVYFKKKFGRFGIKNGIFSLGN